MRKPALHRADVFGSVLSSTLSAWRGTSVVHAAVQPKQNLKLYDMEGSPNCRSVREALTALGLDLEVYPCPKGGKRFWPVAKRLGGKPQSPLLVDPNTSTTLHEPGAIIDYLFQTYGGRATPWLYRSSRLPPLVLGLGSAVRGMRGIQYRKAHAPEKLLALWSFESSPYSRLVRERLTELELAYMLHNIGKEQWADMGPAALRLKPGPYQPRPGGRRAQVLAKFGRVQAPYLEDPNTGAKLYESRDIIDYLEQQYAASTAAGS